MSKSTRTGSIHAPRYENIEVMKSSMQHHRGHSNVRTKLFNPNQPVLNWRRRHTRMPKKEFALADRELQNLASTKRRALGNNCKIAAPPKESLWELNDLPSPRLSALGWVKTEFNKDPFSNLRKSVSGIKCC